MSVHYFKPRNLWFAKWKEEGREKRRYFKSQAEAEAFEAERLQEQAQNDRLTLGELTAAFFRARPDYHPVTKKSIVRLLAGREVADKHIDGYAEFLRDKYADALTRRDLEAMRENMRVTGIGNNTINKAHAYIRAILSWGVDQELIPLHPWRDFKPLKAQKYVVNVSLDTFRRLYAELPPYLQWAAKTAYALALRPGQVELFGLQWSAFLWRRGIVVVRQGKSGMLKTVVPHPAYMQEAQARYEADIAAGIPWVCHRNGRRVIKYDHAWRLACQRAGVHMRPYDIRHLAATVMLGAGADLAAVAAQLGHANVATTGATYAHVTAGAQAHAAALMPPIDGDTR